MNQQAERRVGTIIGAKWRVDALLGSGSMAAVYAVTHRNGARAALKILHPTLCADPAVCERFLGEGYLTNSVKHVGICRVQDDGVTDDGCVFLVMDLLEGSTLEALRQERGGRIPLVETLDLADKLMDVLSAVHGASIIHRDLKPQNVFVCTDGTVKLLDFGVARVHDRASQSKLSMIGLVLGTPSFMSPEQALGSRDKVDHRSDIWSLGATMFTALTGETVHLGAHIQAKLLAAATVKARSIAMAMPALPPPLVAAIDTALRFKKEDRWQSVDAFRRAVLDARQMLGLGLPPEPVQNALRSMPPPGMGSVPPPAFGTVSTPPGPAPAYTPPPAAVQQTAALPPYAPAPGAHRASRPDTHEGSLPAVGGTLRRDVFGDDAHGHGAGRHAKRGAPPWLVGAGVGAVALAGFAFWAFRSPHATPAHGDVLEQAAAPTTTAAPAMPSLAPNELPVVPAAVATTSSVVVDAAVPPATTHATTAVATPAWAAPRTQSTPPTAPHARVEPAPRPAQPAEAPKADDPFATPSPVPRAQPAPPPPGMGQDPFGTPE